MPCSGDNYFRHIVTAAVPPLVLSLWQVRSASPCWTKSPAQKLLRCPCTQLGCRRRGCASGSRESQGLNLLPMSSWQGLVVPRWLYYWAMAERKYPSFTALEKRMLILFFYWAVRRCQSSRS